MNNENNNSLIKELQNTRDHINCANDEFELMYDKVVMPFMNKHNILNKLHPVYAKESFVQFMKLCSQSYINIIRYEKILKNKINILNK